MSTPSKITAKFRENEYPNDFKAVGNALMCIHCNHEVNWQKSSTLSSHVLSLHHLSIKNGGKKTLPTTIQSCLSTQDKKQEFNSDFVEMMLACNIPL